MGDRGPAPKPTEIKKQQGTWRADRETPDEVRPAGTAQCPVWLEPEAQIEWQRLAPELERLGLLTSVDQAAFAAYCSAYARWVAAELMVREEGMTFVTNNGYIQQHPAVGISTRALEQMKGYLQQFGMTPASRARLTSQVPGGKASEQDPEEWLFGGEDQGEIRDPVPGPEPAGP